MRLKKSKIFDIIKVKEETFVMDMFLEWLEKNIMRW